MAARPSLLRSLLFLLATFLSFALCIGVSTLAVRSYWRVGILTWTRWDTGNGAIFHQLTFTAGSVGLSRVHFVPVDADRSLRSETDIVPGWRWADTSMWIPSKLPAGVRSSYQRVGNTHRYTTEIVSPAWLIVVLTLILPSIGAVRFGRGVRSELWSKNGRCAHCGYDIRATPDRCPECGTAVGAVA